MRAKRLLADAARAIGCLMAAGGACCLLLVGCIAVFGGFPDPCGNQILRTIPSPDGRLKVVIFERDCGATTGFSTQVSVVAAAAEPRDEAGNLFVADDDHGAAPGGPGGGPRVEAIWEGRRRLLIRFDPLARVWTGGKHMSVRSGFWRSDRVTIRYVPHVPTRSK